MEIKLENLPIKSLQEKMKKTLLLSILKDIENNPDKALHWAQVYASKLLPNETTVSGDKENPLELKVYDEKQIQNIAQRIVGAGIGNGETECEK